MESLKYCPAQVEVVTVAIEDPVRRLCYELTVPGRTQDDGLQFLDAVGSGTMGAGFRQTTAGMAMEPIRKAYKDRLLSLEKAIAERRATLGAELQDPHKLKHFARWASGERTKTARIWRLPAGPGGVIGGEIYDWRKYGVGGRAFPNLEAKYAKGQPGPATWNLIADKSVGANPTATGRILRAARYLKYGGGVFMVVGAGLSMRQIAMAAPEERLKVAGGEAAGMLGAVLLADLAIGIAFLGFGVVGVPLLLIVLVAGVAGGYLGEQIYYSMQPGTIVHQFEQEGFVHVNSFAGTCPSTL